MKKIIKSLIVCFILLILILLIGCSNKSNNNIDDNSISIKADNEIILSEEDQIWNDAIVDEIYNQRITICDSVNKSLPDSQFSNDISKLNELKNSNVFAKKFLDLLDNSNIEDIINNGSDLEKYLLLSYLCVETNHHEGLGISLNWINDAKIVNSSNQLISVYYREQSYDSNKNLKSDEKYNSKYPYFIFEFSNPNNASNIFILSKGYISSYGSSDINIDTEYTEVKDGKYGGVEVSWIKIDEQTMFNVINKNKDFLDFYLKYKNNVYYVQYDQEHNISGKYQSEDIQKSQKEEPKIGMTKIEVLNSTWGSPKEKNITETKYGKHEQWVYSTNRYIYFDNGIVTSIQKGK